MATPLIEVIEDCEQDIERFRSELKVIIAEADEDGVRDDDENKEIKTFEDSIADLEKFAQEKRAEFERNRDEWEALSAKVSELRADFQTLTEWGEPGLQIVDQKINEMDAAANNQFFRDAITIYQAAQTYIDPMMEDYNQQSAAKLTYEEELKAAKQRAADCRGSEASTTEIEATLDQIDTDLGAANSFVEQLDYVNALSALQRTIEKIAQVEKTLADNKRSKEIILGTYTDLVKQYTDAKETLSPYEDLLDQIINEFDRAVQQFNDLMEANNFDQAELVLQNAKANISIALEQAPAREAAQKAEQERIEAQEALLQAERDQLASDLSAAAPTGALWKLYAWKQGDSFEKLAKDSQVKNAEVLLGYPNNKKLSEYYQANKELPVGTLVCVVDPSVKIFKMTLEGEEVFLTEDVLAGFTAENSKLMSALSTNLNALFLNLEKNNTAAYEARHMVGWLTRYMTGWDVAEPAKEREKARASVKALNGSFSPENAEQFAALVVTAAADCEAYKGALQEWLREMQSELNASMETLEFYDKVAKTCAVVAFVTVAAPASISVGALYTFGSVSSAAITAGGASAALSLYTDGLKITAAAVTGAESPVTRMEALKNSISAGLTTGLSALVFGGIFSKIGPAIASRIGSIGVVQTQAARLLGKPFWYGRIVDMVKFTDAGAKLAESAGGTIRVETLAPVVTPVLTEGFLKLFGRVAWGESVALRNYIASSVTGYIDNNPTVLEKPSEEAVAKTIADNVLDDAAINGIFDVIVKEHQAELEKIFAEELATLDL